MSHRTRGVAAAALIITGVALAACTDVKGETPEAKIATVERIPGSDIGQVTLSADAARRLGIQTDLVRETVVAGEQRKTVPYAAVLYDAEGDAYAYSNPKPLVFTRVVLDIDDIEGDLAVLDDGPPLGTAVVTVGAAELFGTEFAVGK